MGCGPCGTNTAISDASAALINNFQGSQFSGAVTSLLRALDQVEMRTRFEPAKVSWKPSQFPQKTVPYKQKPEGTEVVVKNTPIYFEDNASFTYNLSTPGPEGGICEGVSLCGEPPANKVPGDTYQTFTWRMEGTAWETPLFCLKDLLFYENGPEMLGNFLKNVDRTGVDFYDNYIRNKIWEIGEKYVLGATEIGLLWNSPDRVSARVAPNLNDYKTFSGDGDVAAPNIMALTYLKYILNQFMGDDVSSFNLEGNRDLMMVATDVDLHSILFNDANANAPVSYLQGGQGFNLFNFSIVNQLPFGFKNEDKWFRLTVDAGGEFVRVPAKVYVNQNGGQDLRTNPAWLTAPYGVLTFMTARPLVYRTFGNLPGMPSNVPAESLRFLRPRFQWTPLLEKCNYARGIVGWRAEDEFGFQPTGEKIIHVIYRRDSLSSYLRNAVKGSAITAFSETLTPIPQTCALPQVEGCCAVAGQVISAVDYRDTTYNLTFSGDIISALAIDIDPLPAAASFKTAKGVFSGLITAVSSDGTLVTFAVDPDEHIGGHFCCVDQLIGFVTDAEVPHCQALLDGGLRPDPFDPTHFIGQLSQAIDAEASDTVAVFFDESCGYVAYVEADVVSIDTRRIVLSFTEADFPDGVNCDDAVKVCAFEADGCEGCIDSSVVECEADGVTPIDFTYDDHED